MRIPLPHLDWGLEILRLFRAPFCLLFISPETVSITHKHPFASKLSLGWYNVPEDFGLIEPISSLCKTLYEGYEHVEDSCLRRISFEVNCEIPGLSDFIDTWDWYLRLAYYEGYLGDYIHYYCFPSLPDDSVLCV